MESSQRYLSQNRQVPYLRRGKLRLLVDLRKLNTLIADDYTNNNHLVSTLSEAAQHLAEKSLFCKLDCSQAYHCLQIADRKGLHSILPAELLRTEDLRKVSADLRLLFRVSCASTWTQLSKLTNVLNTLTTLELQPIMLRILPGTFGQSSSVFARQDWNWQLRSATLESDRLKF